LLVTTEGELLGSSRAAAAAGGAAPLAVFHDSHTSVLDATDPSTTVDITTANLTMLDDHAIGTLITDIAMDYYRLGQECANLVVAPPDPDDAASSSRAATPSSSSSKSQLSCLLIEMAKGIVGVSSCAGGDCLVILVADVDTPLGLIKARCQALSSHVQQALSTLVNEAA
jgi:hypothetical protein